MSHPRNSRPLDPNDAGDAFVLGELQERKRVTELTEHIAAGLDTMVQAHVDMARLHLEAGDYSQAATYCHRAHQARLQGDAVRSVTR